MNLEELKKEFEIEYGKDKKTGYGQWLDLTKMPNNPEKYRSMVTEFAWKAFCHGRLGINPNKVNDNE